MSLNLTKILKKIRIDNDDVLYTMARKLDMSSGYLSAIENGKREIPNNFVDKINKIYVIDPKTQIELNAAIAKAKNYYKVNLSNMSNEKKDAFIVFARKFEDMDDETIKKLLLSLEKENK